MVALNMKWLGGELLDRQLTIVCEVMIQDDD
jgi:hypothetical protein